MCTTKSIPSTNFQSDESLPSILQLIIPLFSTPRKLVLIKPECALKMSR